MYDYQEGKKRIQNILNNNLEVFESGRLPDDSNFTFENAYKSWISAIFVDIRNSTDLFTIKNKTEVSKIIRSFTSEIIEILRLNSGNKEDSRLREIGIRGDCVYGIYTTPKKIDEYDIAEKAFYINTFMRMLNKLLSSKGFYSIKAGIGVATAKELIVKAGRKGVGINNAVWIGSAVTIASKLSGVANKNNISPIAFSNSSYDNIIKLLIENNSGKNPENWLKREYNFDCGYYYHGDIVDAEFYNWINNGMV